MVYAMLSANRFGSGFAARLGSYRHQRRLNNSDPVPVMLCFASKHSFSSRPLTSKVFDFLSWSFLSRLFPITDRGSASPKRRQDVIAPVTLANWDVKEIDHLRTAIGI